MSLRFWFKDIPIILLWGLASRSRSCLRLQSKFVQRLNYQILKPQRIQRVSFTWNFSHLLAPNDVYVSKLDSSLRSFMIVEPGDWICMDGFSFWSAGVGRTGTFIGYDALLKRGKETGRINVFEFVKKMREDRMTMIQTKVVTIFLIKLKRNKNTIVNRTLIKLPINYDVCVLYHSKQNMLHIDAF